MRRAATVSRHLLSANNNRDALASLSTSTTAGSSSSSSSPNSEKTPLCVVVGAGDGIGKALARRFARGGYTLVLVRRTREPLLPVVEELMRTSGRRHYAYGLDARKEEDVKRLFDVEIASLLSREGGNHELRVVVHNIGGNVQFSLQDTTERVYRKVWELCSLSAFLVGREASRAMLAQNRGGEYGKGCLIFTGATASIRGKEGYAAFSAGMQGKRALAQSMAREYQPLGLHVASVIIDGAVDTDKVAARFEKAGGSAGAAMFDSMRKENRVLDPDSIANTFFHIAHEQTVDAWTHEVDLRPYAEKF